MPQITTDPLTDAEAALTAAVQALADAQENDRLLRQRVLDGEGTVTAQELADSGDQVEHAKLGAKAARLAVHAAQRKARHDRLVAKRDEEILPAAGDPDELLAEMTAAEQHIANILQMLSRRDTNQLNKWDRSLAAEGVPANGDPSEEHAMLARTSTEWGGETITIHVGNRAIRDVRPSAVLAAVIARACTATGYNLRGLSLDVDVIVDGRTKQIAADPDGWINANY